MESCVYLAVVNGAKRQQKLTAFLQKSSIVLLFDKDPFSCKRGHLLLTVVVVCLSIDLFCYIDRFFIRNINPQG